jgi:hypothetical protein
MTDDNNSLYLSRILSGYYYFILNNQKYKLVYPDISIRYQAEIYADEEKDSNKYNEWLTDEDIIDYLISHGMWSRDGDSNLKDIEEKIEDHKVDLYKNVLNPNNIKTVKRHLEGARKSYNRLYNLRHLFDHLTLNGYSESIKNQYLLIHSIYTNKDERVFGSIEDSDNLMLNSFADHISSNIIDIKTFREIARSDIWRNYWSANKNAVFDKAVVNWTDEQKTLVVLTKMYDGAHEHTECPPDSVFEDDDMFDGWMISQRRENEKSRSKNRTEKMLEGKKLNRAQEVYLVASSQEEVKNIYGLNDNQSRSIINEREKIIEKTGQGIDHSHLPDIQRDLTVQTNQQYIRSVKGK